jgi:KipI family sensor histidine kinase inhibitor
VSTPARVRPVRPFGDGAVVAEVGSVSAAHGLATAVSAVDWPGIEDVVVGYRSVTVVANPDRAELGALQEQLACLPGTAPDSSSPRRVEIPVAFDGPDLDEVAALAGLSRAGVVELLAGSDLRVAFVGFLPGFAYLDGLAPALAGVARRSSPRPTVAGGSFGIGGGFAGIYPQASPGGWQLLGRTGFRLFNPESPPFAALRPGDVVRLVAAEDPGQQVTASRARLRSSAPWTAEVDAPGLLTMVQDLGRAGVAALGVPHAGAADTGALRAANRLVGNAAGAAGLEVTALGPRLRFTAAAHVAVVGRVDVTLDGRPLEVDNTVPVAPGQVLSVGTTHGELRCYVAVAGGFDVAPVLGSRSSDVLTGLGPGALQTGDVIGIGAPTRPRGRLRREAVPHSGASRAEHVLRVMPELETGNPDAAAGLTARVWEVGSASDRVGLRLSGDEPLTGSARGPGSSGPGSNDPGSNDPVSRGMVTGAVQLPPDGQPVALLCDHATVGGYRVVATVVRADLGVLGQCRPGDRVRFQPVDLAEADRARAAAERAIDRAVVGWYPVRTD